MTSNCESWTGCDARVEELQAEFGSMLTQRILDAEAADFLWDARRAERYLGQHMSGALCAEDDGDDLSRIAVISLLAGQWQVGICLVDGEGAACGLAWRRIFDDQGEAEFAFSHAR